MYAIQHIASDANGHQPKQNKRGQHGRPLQQLEHKTNNKGDSPRGIANKPCDKETE